MAVVYEHEVLEKQLMQEVRDLDQRYKVMDDQRVKVSILHIEVDHGYMFELPGFRSGPRFF